MRKVYPERICPQCQLPFRHPDRRQKFCSMKCRTESYKGKGNPNFQNAARLNPKDYPFRICSQCGKEYQSPKATQQFCSRACKSDALRTGHISQYGYRLISFNDKQVLEHRYVMEQHLGRKLLRSETVHHKDGNRLNNDISNLELFSDHALHLAAEKKDFRSETHKECNRCHEVKLRDEFSPNAKVKTRPLQDPHQSLCKKCYAAEQKARRHARG